MIANDKWAYKTHVVLRPPLNFLRLALQFMHAHLIDKRMGTHEAIAVLHNAVKLFTLNSGENTDAFTTTRKVFT